MSTATQGIDIVVGARTQQATAAMNLLNGFVQGIGMAVANYAGRAARALGEMTGQALHTADEMGKAAQKAGTTAEKFSAVAYAAKLSDVSIGSLQVGIKGLSAWMERNGQIGRDVVDVLLEQADAFESMEDGAGKTNRAVELFGRSGLEMIPLLNQGSDALRRQMEEAKGLGVVISGDTARAAETFNDRITTMKTRFEGVFLQLADTLLPSLLTLSDTMMASLESGGPFIDFLLEAGGIISTVADASGYLAEKWAFLTTGMGSFVGSLAAGLSVEEAWAEATKDAAEAQDGFRTAVAKYRDERTKASDTNKKAVTEANGMASAVDTLRMRFEQLSLNRDELAPQAQLERVKKQRSLLQPIEASIGQPEMKGDLYTEEGLKNAKALLDVKKAESEIDRQMLALHDGLRQPGVQEQFLTRFRENFAALGTTMQQAADIATNTVGAAMHGLAGAITDVIMGSKSAGEAFAQLGLSLLTNFIASVLEMILIATVAIPLLTTLGILSGGATVGSGLGITLGAISLGTSAAGKVTGGYAEGGVVHGPGTSTSDSILARLSDGEGILTATATEQLGADGLAHLNAGGDVSDLAGAQTGNVSIGIFGIEAAAMKWLDSREGRKAFVNLIREEVGTYS